MNTSVIFLKILTLPIQCKYGLFLETLRDYTCMSDPQSIGHHQESNQIWINNGGHGFNNSTNNSLSTNASLQANFSASQQLAHTPEFHSVPTGYNQTSPINNSVNNLSSNNPLLNHITNQYFASAQQQVPSLYRSYSSRDQLELNSQRVPHSLGSHQNLNQNLHQNLHQSFHHNYTHFSTPDANSNPLATNNSLFNTASPLYPNYSCYSLLNFRIRASTHRYRSYVN